MLCMKRVHYGWWVCFGCALLLFCTSGLTVNAFTVYQPYILNQNGFTNAQSSSIITVRSLFSFLAMFLTGVYFKKFSLRTGMGLAGLMTALGFFVFGIAKTYFLYCLGGALLGLGFGFGSMVPIAIMLEHWFAQKRTLAVSICSAATGLATFGIPSLITWLITHTSLAIAFWCEAGFIAAMTLISFLLIRDHPGQKDLEAYGAGALQKAQENLRQAVVLEKKHWFLLVPMLLLIGAMTSVGFSHLSMLVSGEGFSSHITALAITVSGVSLAVSKCIYGWVSDKLGNYRTNFLFGGVLLLGMVLCCMVRAGVVVVFIAMCTYGAGLALTTTGLVTWAGDLSSPATFDITVRRFQIGYAAGGLVFSTLPGILADQFGGSYIPAYIFFTACTVYILFSVQWTYRQCRK